MTQRDWTSQPSCSTSPVASDDPQRASRLAVGAAASPRLLPGGFEPTTRQALGGLGQLPAQVPPGQEVQCPEGRQDDGQVLGHAMRQPSLVHGPGSDHQRTHARAGEILIPIIYVIMAALVTQLLSFPGFTEIAIHQKYLLIH